MKILAFVDMHGNLSILKRIAEASKHADIVLCAGDLTRFEINIRQILCQLNAIGKTILIIPGNHESESVLKSSCTGLSNVICLHNRGYMLCGCLFLGYGGGGFSVRDKGFEEACRLFRKQINLFKKSNPLGKVVLITHAPPYGTRLDALMKSHTGNKSIQEFIYENNINLAVSGHIHENAGKEDCIGRTKLINPYPFHLIDI